METFLKIIGVLSWALAVLVFLATATTVQGPLIAAILLVNGSVLFGSGAICAVMRRKPQ